jgi:hypothetical protein
LKHKLKILSKELQCPSTTFLIKDCNILLHYYENLSKQSQAEQTMCQDLLDAMAVAQEEGVMSPSNKKSKSKRSTPKTNEKINIPLKVYMTNSNKL